VTKVEITGIFMLIFLLFGSFMTSHQLSGHVASNERCMMDREECGTRWSWSVR